MNLTCRTCGQSKPETEYYTEVSKRGRTLDCKACYKLKQNQRRWGAELGTVTPEPKKCESCGAELPNRRGKYCPTGECKRQRENHLQRERARRRTKARRAANPLPHCKHCGKELHNHNANYCMDRECQAVRGREWFDENAELRREYNRKNKAKRRALRKSCRTDDVTWHGIMERDHWTCQLCGKPIDPDLKAPDPKSATWDHIIPLVEGGDHTWANLQASHYGCNARKSNRGEPQQLALI